MGAAPSRHVRKEKVTISIPCDVFAKLGWLGVSLEPPTPAWGCGFRLRVLRRGLPAPPRRTSRDAARLRTAERQPPAMEAAAARLTARELGEWGRSLPVKTFLARVPSGCSGRLLKGGAAPAAEEGAKRAQTAPGPREEESRRERWRRKRGALEPKRLLLRLAGCRFPPRPHPEAAPRATSPLSGPSGRVPCSERRSQGQVGLGLCVRMLFFAGDQRWAAEMLAVAKTVFWRPGFGSSHLLNLDFHINPFLGR